ncbi:MAG: hypothetical protein ACOC1K_01830, partial [Nanoarchaeota archaeon]
MIIYRLFYYRWNLRFANDKYLRSLFTNSFTDYENNLDQIEKNDIYLIELSKNQLELISFCCDVISRIKAGQIKEIKRVLSNINTNNNDLKVIDYYLREIKKIYFSELEENSYYGITNTELDENAKILYDIHQVIRNTIAWKNQPEGNPLRVDFDPVFKTSSQEEIPTVRVKKN